MAAERDIALDTLLLVFARAPRRGRVKTRLIPELGEDAALAVHQRLLDRTLLEAAAFPGRAKLMLDDQDDGLAARAREMGLEVGLQQGGGLGERMNTALRGGLQEAARVLLVGSDCPVLDQTYLSLAVDGLNDARVVLGASEDGGYVLIGGSDAAVWHDGRFEGVRLGTDYAMADTLVALNDAAPVSVLPPLWDVDIPEDVARARTLGVLP
ncbi:MAG: TIGR04282 family arsenosugar biosynthesis glycosyltransferase [Alcanivorax sp.]|nr:TIGR04282 family arsenosugar biosynthesis glycosyltransferase [Alcanivorax sp.]